MSVAVPVIDPSVFDSVPAYVLVLVGALIALGLLRHFVALFIGGSAANSEIYNLTANMTIAVVVPLL